MNEGFQLQIEDGTIQYRSPGRLTITREGGPDVQLAFFFWRDAWVYERLDGGEIQEGPIVDEQGRLHQQGMWGTHGDASPISYTLALQPDEEALLLQLDLTKTAPLKLTDGVWATLWMDRADFTAGQQFYARPTTHGKFGKAVETETDTLFIELNDRIAATFQPDGFRRVRSRGGDTSRFEMNLLPGDFPVGETRQLALRIGFERMPTDFLGDIQPRRQLLEIGTMHPTDSTFAQYAPIELALDLHGTWDNPFDPDDIALDAILTTASGRVLRQPGFFMVDHERVVQGDVEFMEPINNGRWGVRFTGTEVGPLHCELVARDRTGEVRQEVGPFEIVPGKRKGLLRQSPVDPHYLRFDNGERFLPIGHNLPIYHSSGQLAEEAIRKMAANGENYNRWWMSRGGLGLEWEETLGWYRQAQAAQLDAMLDLAEELDFYYMLCFDTHQDFREDGWKLNPFNAANGGPCESVSDWFTNAEAKSYYRKRLRYIVARWGYSTHVLCWEFGNEFEGWADTPQPVKIAWHREMAPFLAQLDPYRHLITTSWWSKTGPEECWQIPDIDIVQTHCYTNHDGNVALDVHEYAREQWERFDKPHIFGEFGIRSHSTTADKDPKGWGLHNAFWSGVMSGECGIPMPWWHESYIDPLNLYFHFDAISRFTRDEPFGTVRWEPLDAVEIAYETPPDPLPVRDSVVIPVSRWGRLEHATFVVESDGTVTPAPPQELLHGNGHRDLRNPPTFVVEYPRPGQFILHVGRVSSSGLLRITLDDRLVLERAFPCGEGIGKEWTFREQWNLWESVYDEDVSIDVPAGKHRIRVENVGNDWMQVTRYVFTGCTVLSKPDLFVTGIRTDDRALVWIQNRESTWFQHERGEVSEVPPNHVVLDGFSEGTYQVEWWNTWDGKPLRIETLQVHDGKLMLRLGPVATDVAVKVWGDGRILDLRF